MRIRLASVFAALMLASASAFAFHCPADMKKIDAALAKNPKLTAKQAADVKKFRADGEALHKAKAPESVDTLARREDPGYLGPPGRCRTPRTPRRFLSAPENQDAF
jgi:hypothetical protein